MVKKEKRDSSEKFEKQLMEQLTNAKLTKEQLRQFSNTIVELRKHSIIPERIWRYGQPAIDGLVLEGRLALDDVKNLADIVKTPNLRGVEVFPLGIINPDVFELRLKIGEQIQQFQR
jgi:hypothetical protein